MVTLFIDDISFRYIYIRIFDNRVAKMSTHSTTWQFKTTKLIQRPIKKLYLTPGSKLVVPRSIPTSPHLRASFCKYRESGDSFKIFTIFIFCSNKAFSELFSKLQLKDPKTLEFFQNGGKLKIAILASRRL